MFKKEFVPRLLIGLGVAAAIVAGFFLATRGSHVELKGSIQKIRTLGFDEGTIVVADFRFNNPSDLIFIVRKADVILVDKSGKRLESPPISEVDTGRMFEGYPILGQKFNETLKMRTKIQPRSGLDRMLAARFDVPEAEVQQRKNLILRIEDMDGAVSEISERPL